MIVPVPVKQSEEYDSIYHTHPSWVGNKTKTKQSPAQSCTHITMTSQWAIWRLKSPASPLLFQPFIQKQIKENIKAPRHWPLCGEFTGDKWPVTRKMVQFDDVIMISNIRVYWGSLQARRSTRGPSYCQSGKVSLRGISQSRRRCKNVIDIDKKFEASQQRSRRYAAQFRGD